MRYPGLNRKRGNPFVTPLTLRPYATRLMTMSSTVIPNTAYTRRTSLRSDASRNARDPASVW